MSSIKPMLLKHLSGEPQGRFPVWFMRQAGRYLPSYREIRARHSFWEMVSTPEVAAEVTLLPVRELGVDAAILFSDILTPVYGMNVPIEMKESIGPVLKKPFSSEKDFNLFSGFEAEKHTSFVGNALTIVREKLAPEKALIGFAGAPWTVACYLIEGQGKTKFHTIQKWAYERPEELSSILERLAKMTASYLSYQIKKGADLIQLFDTWLSEMPREFFEKHYFKIVSGLFSSVSDVPKIFYSKHTAHFMDRLGKLPIQVLSVDSTVSLTQAEKLSGGRLSLQGNLDPLMLFCDPSLVRLHTRLLVEEAGTLGRPALINLGHGVLPEAPLESVKAFVKEGQTLWV